MQGAFDTLIGMFSQVGLRVNIGKMIGMGCRPFQAAGPQSEAPYKGWMMGEGLLYWYMHIVQMKCSECGEEMSVGSLEVHQLTQYGE